MGPFFTAVPTPTVTLIGNSDVVVEVTVTEALAERPSSVTVTDPDPADEPAMKVVDEPIVVERDPGAVVVQVAEETSNGFPFWSVPVAVKETDCPVPIVAVVGETVSVVRVGVVDPPDDEVYSQLPRPLQRS